MNLKSIAQDTLFLFSFPAFILASCNKSKCIRSGNCNLIKTEKFFYGFIYWMLFLICTASRTRWIFYSFSLPPRPQCISIPVFKKATLEARKNCNQWNIAMLNISPSLLPGKIIFLLIVTSLRLAKPFPRPLLLTIMIISGKKGR